MESDIEGFLESIKGSPYENVCRAGIDDFIDKEVSPDLKS